MAETKKYAYLLRMSESLKNFYAKRADDNGRSFNNEIVMTLNSLKIEIEKGKRDPRSLKKYDE